jgi:hypothetical protein
LAAACGARCTPWEGSAIASWYWVTAAGQRPPWRVRCAAGCVDDDSRALVVWGQVAAHAAAHGHRASVADVCAVAVSSARLGGAWVVAARGGDPDFVMCVTDLVSEQLAELQLMLGEGPCHDVLVSAGPVLAGDLGDAESGRRWAAVTPAARGLGAGAVFAFPLIVGRSAPG